MTSDLLRAVGELVIQAEELGEESIDDKLSRQRPQTGGKGDRDTLKRDLESDFLTPSTSFGPEWLNKLQQYVFHRDVHGL